MPEQLSDPFDVAIHGFHKMLFRMAPHFSPGDLQLIDVITQALLQIKQKYEALESEQRALESLRMQLLEDHEDLEDAVNLWLMQQRGF